MSEETGMFGDIMDESIEAGKGVTYSSGRAMHDPMAGITGLEGGELSGITDPAAG